MTISSKLAVLVLGAGVTLACTNALAAGPQADASVVVSGFQLIDLDPNDGMAPAIAFFGTQNYLENRVNDTRSPINEISTNRSTTNFDPLSSTLSMAHVNASVGNGGGQFGSLTSQATLAGKGQFGSMAMLNTGFTITPKTLLVLFGHVTINRSVDPTDASQEAHASANMSLTGGLMGNNIGFQSSGFNQYYYGAQNVASNHFDHDFSASFSNLTSAALNGQFNSQVAIYGAGLGGFVPPPTSPVPEPETYAMMLAGLGLLAAVARRRAGK